MNRLEKIRSLRQHLASGKVSVGSWIQLPSASSAEIMGQAGYDWVAVDLEHGSIDIHQLPDIFRALELGGTLPLVRVAQGQPKDCKQALDSGAGGIIVPMISNAQQLISVRDSCRWPPAGKRGVGFSRANLYGKHFKVYSEEAQGPLLIAMIEDFRAIENLKEILTVEGLDAILIGPYDLSASMGITGEFEDATFKSCIQEIQKLCKEYHIPGGVHVVSPDPAILKQRINEGYQFIAYSLDSVFLGNACLNPLLNLE